MLWDPHLDFQCLLVSKQLIHFKVHIRDGELLFTIAYGANDIMERRRSWIELANMASNIQSCWFITSDFNSKLSFEDRIGGNCV